MDPIARTPEPPYYAVVFTSVRKPADPEGYAAMADRMVELASSQPGFLGVESVRDAHGVGITMSYWASLAAIRHWREHAEHQVAQSQGRSTWYREYRLRICRDCTRGLPKIGKAQHHPGDILGRPLVVQHVDGEGIRARLVRIGVEDQDQVTGMVAQAHRACRLRRHRLRPAGRRRSSNHPGSQEDQQGQRAFSHHQAGQAPEGERCPPHGTAEQAG
jgi:heme-degrading monooxygenase HmoA